MLEQIVHLWMFGPVPLADALGALARTGADGVDLSVSLQSPHNNLEVLNRADSLKTLADSGLPVRVVTPLYKLPVLDFSHPLADVQQTVVNFTNSCIDLACKVGASRVLLAPSYIGPDCRLHCSYEEDWRQAVLGLRQVAAHAEKQGVRLMLEPINRYMVTLVHTVAEGLRMIEEVGSSALCLVPDTFHMNIEEEGGVLGGIAAAKGHIGCLHVGDNNRKPPGFGAMDWPAILHALALAGFDGPLSHEPVALYYRENAMAESRRKEQFIASLAESIRSLRMD